MSITNVYEAKTMDDASRQRVAEAVDILRYKDVKSATIERLKISWEADAYVQGLPQPLQLGEGMYYLLDRISLPVSPDDLLLGRIVDEVPDADGEAVIKQAAEVLQWGTPQWMPDGGHECFDWERLLAIGLPGREKSVCQEITRRTGDGETGAHLGFLRGAVRIYQAY